MAKIEFEINLEKGIPIPEAHSSKRRPPVVESMWAGMLREAEHGDSLLIPLWSVVGLRVAARNLGFDIAYRKTGEKIAIKGAGGEYDAGAARVWILKNSTGKPQGAEKKLADRITELEAKLGAWKTEVGKVMPEDFKSWHQNCDEELPLVTRRVIESLKQREELAWAMPPADHNAAVVALFPLLVAQDPDDRSTVVWSAERARPRASFPEQAYYFVESFAKLLNSVVENILRKGARVDNPGVAVPPAIEKGSPVGGETSEPEKHQPETVVDLSGAPTGGAAR